ncbi:MAG: cadherin-like beta sandwich domain-containing protein [Firmicutes bacterium]|nr:cadherin-like beta sandwich domain-containing protein [Bacillota bacterium]
MRQRNTGRKSIRRCLPVIGLAVMLTMAWIAFGGGAASAADRDIEWGSYQNSAENNGVVGGIPTPQSYEETSLLWGKKMVDGYTVSFTPPLIIDGDLITASNKHVYRIDKRTGDIKATSAELKLNVGYAMNPITYDREKDQFYVPIMNGRVQCLDGEDLSSKWISREYKYNQTLSPIACKGGLVYTGIWETETDDGVFFCLDGDTGEEVWTFRPSEHGDLPHGFYWAGAYVNDDHVVVGSDDGANNTFAEASDEAYPATAVAYCFDRRTGAVIDRITGIKGDVRSTVAYHKGFVYFVSKGGCLYKAALGADGKFSQVSSIQLKDDRGVDVMMTSTPVIHKGRIYAGAAGSGGQFSADGGHMFAVIRDDPSLSAGSLIYRVPISGYPQAAPLLSTATEDTDGKVRLYFTFNAFPGGIYCLEDSAEATAEHHEKAHLLYRPEKEMQQYCISPLCCDREGTFYFKNDSGYMMAVSMNKAWLSGIDVTCAQGGVVWENAFTSGTLNYTLNAPGGAEEVKITPQIPEGSGMTVRVDGKDFTGQPVAAAVGTQSRAVPVEVTKTAGDRSWTRTYTLNISSASDNANLAGIAINDNNTKPQIVDTEDRKASGIGVGYDPDFDAAIADYTGRTYGGKNTYLNIWLQTADSKASLRVIPVSNVGNSSPGKFMNEDGTLRPGNDKSRYPVYWVKGANSAEVDVEVTSASGQSKKVYHVTLVRGKDHLDVGEEPLTLTPPSAVLATAGRQQSVQISASFRGEDVTGECAFESTDPAVATVSGGGKITAVSAGEAEIWVELTRENRRGRIHVEVESLQLEPPTASLRSGTYAQPLQLALQSDQPGAQIRYNIAEGEDEPPAPTTTTGTVYDGPIAIGRNGESVSVTIRAIACGKGFSKSDPAEFRYTVDLREGPKTEPNTVSLEPGSIAVAEKDAAAFAALPPGTSYEALAGKLAAVKTVRVTLTKGSDVSGVDLSDPDHPRISADVTWDGEETYAYDPADSREQKFLVGGTVTLPEGVSDGGSTLRVYLSVTVCAAPKPAPAPVPAPGAVNGFSAKVSAKSKAIIVSWNPVAGAGGYVVGWRKAGDRWNTAQVSGTSHTLSGLASGGCYEVRTAAVNASGQSGWSPSEYCLIQKTTLKVKAGKKSFTAKMKKVKKVSGYQVRYSLQNNMAGAKKKNGKKPKITVKKLQKKKVYYVQAMPYKKTGGAVYYGEAVSKKVKIKK